MLTSLIVWLEACHTKISLARSILSEHLPELVYRTTFADKIGPDKSVLAPKSGSLLVNVGPPSALCETEVCNNLAIAT